MKLSISNIAWDTSFEKQVIALLLVNNIVHLDFAPGKFFSDIENVTDEVILKVKNEGNHKGISL